MMGRNSDVIQSFWQGDTLSDMERMCILSYLKRGHPFHLYVYRAPRNCPSGTCLKDASEIMPEESVFIDVFGGFVNFSNIFRYMLLYRRGGWWVDMDTVCLRPFNFDAPYVFSSEQRGDRFSVNTTYIKSPAGSILMKACLDFAVQRGHEFIHWGELGVSLLSRMVFRYRLQRYIQRPTVFCPVSGSCVRQFIEAPGVDISSESYALHWWHELWRRNGWDQNGAYPGSIYNSIREECLAYKD